MGTMRIAHDLSSFTQQPSIKPFLLEITCRVQTGSSLPSTLIFLLSRFVPLRSRTCNPKFGFASATRSRSLRDNRIFAIPLPLPEKVGRKRGLIFLGRSSLVVVGRGREARDGSGKAANERGEEREGRVDEYDGDENELSEWT